VAKILAISAYCCAFFPCLSEAFAHRKLHAPLTEGIFDGFWRREAQKSVDFSRRAAAKDAEIHR
jgi:hypothetical protein